MKNITKANIIEIIAFAGFLACLALSVLSDNAIDADGWFLFAAIVFVAIIADAAISAILFFWHIFKKRPKAVIIKRLAVVLFAVLAHFLMIATGNNMDQYQNASRKVTDAIIVKIEGFMQQNNRCPLNLAEANVTEKDQITPYTSKIKYGVSKNYKGKEFCYISYPQGMVTSCSYYFHAGKKGSYYCS